MMKRILLLAMLLSIITGTLVAAQEDLSPVARAAAFVLTLQNEDGGFSNGWSAESDLSATADVVLGLAAAEMLAGEEGEALTNDLMAYLQAQVSGDEPLSVGQLSKVISALVASGSDPRAFAEQDLVAELLSAPDVQGMFGFGAFDHCLALIALQNAGVATPETALEVLVSAQNEDGGWGFMAGERSDSNTTGLCLQALAPTDESDVIAAALAYLDTIQNEDGGWPYQNPSDWGTDSDANSTSIVLQALIALDQDLAEWQNPQEWLLSVQNESGALRFQMALPDDNFLATVAALPALAGMPLNAWAPELETAQ